MLHVNSMNDPGLGAVGRALSASLHRADLAVHVLVIVAALAVVHLLSTRGDRSESRGGR